MQSQPRFIFWTTTLLLVAALILTYVSSLHLCSEACAEGQNYRLFGLPFELWGYAILAGLLGVHLMTLRYPLLSWAVLAMLCGAAGSELWFIYVQKYLIGQWCPICLSIAACVFLALFFQIIGHAYGWRQITKTNNEGEKMKFAYGSLASIATVFIGFLIAFVGLSKIDKLEAAQEGLKEKITFGNASSPIEVYLFTDWQCPSCRKIEPVIEKIAPKIMTKAKLVFVDLPIHQETMNYTPYNLAFMVNNKDKYLKLRDILTTLSQQTGAPTEEQVEKAIAPLGVKYQQLNYADVAVGFKYYKDLAKQFGVTATPTLVIVNLDTKKGKKLKGGAEITETNILNAIDAIKE